MNKPNYHLQLIKFNVTQLINEKEKVFSSHRKKGEGGNQYQGWEINSPQCRLYIINLHIIRVNYGM